MNLRILKIPTVLGLLLFGLATLGFSQKAEASICLTSFKTAAIKCAADPKCQKAAADLLVKFKAQVKLCKVYRQALKTCRKAKRSEKKECRAEKRTCKKKCKRGRKGNNCRKACRKAKRACKKAARKAKRACRNEARNTKAFAICKDGRKLTRKAGGKFALCATKHFLPAAIKCAAALCVGGF